MTKAETIMNKIADCDKDPMGPVDPLMKLLKEKAKIETGKAEAVKDIAENDKS